MSNQSNMTAANLLATPRYAPAAAAYDAVLNEHSLYADGSGVCKCGQTFRRNQAFGQHLGAARRRAEKAFDAAIMKA